MALALAATIVVILPVALTGAMGVSLRQDLAISLGQLGIAVSAYFGVSAICSPLLGRVGQRVGPRAAVRGGVGLAAAAMLLMGAAASSFAAVLGCLALAGVANALTQPSINDFLAGVTEPERLAVAFGIKQSAVPGAVLVSGLAVPALAGTLGWRMVFLVAVGAAAAVVAAFGAASPAPAPSKLAGEVAEDEARLLLGLALAAGLAAMGGNAISTFMVSAGVHRGLSEAAGGLLLAAGSVTCVLVRVVVGHAVARRHSDGLRPFAVLLASGAVGFVALAAGPAPLFVVGSLLAFGGGWGWAGVFQFIVVSRNPQAVARATGLTQMGVYVGAALGPLLFGVVASSSYGDAWALMAVAAAASALLAWAARARSGRQARTHLPIE